MSMPPNCAPSSVEGAGVTCMQDILKRICQTKTRLSGPRASKAKRATRPERADEAAREGACRGVRGAKPLGERELNKESAMSEDRLERALREMNEEDVDAGTLEGARARVWEKGTNTDSATCTEFRQDFRAYLANELSGSRRLLVDDHLSRCPGCRTRIAEMKGERRLVAMPRRSSSRWVQWGALAAAAAGLAAVLYLGRDAIDTMMGPGGSRATVVSADGGLYRLSSEAGSAKAENRLEAGAAIGERESLRTGPGAHAVLRLADGSVVDVNE